jgi:hypothetical protein
MRQTQDQFVVQTLPYLLHPRFLPLVEMTRRNRCQQVNQERPNAIRALYEGQPSYSKNHQRKID